MDEKSVFSLQAQLIRKMQEADGHTVCFATKVSNECPDKGCCWRHDCFDEAKDVRTKIIDT